MKRIKLVLGTLLGLTVLFANTAFANNNQITDTLKVVVNGEVKAVIDMDELEDLQDLKDLEEINLDSIMLEVEAALEEVDEEIENVEIFDDGITKRIVIKDDEGNVIEEVEFEIPDIEIEMEIDEDEDDFEVEFETNKSDKRVHGFMSYEIGSNNYLENQNFPSGDMPYVVKPFGSWSFSIGTGIRTYATSWLSFDLGADLLWYNFKMEDKTIDITEGLTPSEINFTPNPTYDMDKNDAIRSKLRVSYLNASFMPVFHIGKNKGGFNKRTFRIGAGAYAGYRIGSMTKNVYEENGQKRKIKDHDNFYLNNFRYGAKAMIGIKEVNVFFNYDLNTLFEEGKGPNGKDLNAFTFGLNFTI